MSSSREKYAEQIAAILAEWSSNLLQYPHQSRALSEFLAADFIATSLMPADR